MTAIARPDIAARAPGRAQASLARLLGLRATDAAWLLPATIGVIALAALLYIVNLTVSGYANTYYAAAALAGSQSWSAWFFGSIDPANFITVDKPPLGTMVIGLSVRLFGLSSWSVLLPQALAGVATVIVLMAAVRRTFGSPSAVIAGLVCALTPAAVLIFRIDDPDAVLTLLLVGAAYALVRSLDAGRLRWVILAAALVGFAFLTKYLQAYLVLPTFALVWLVAAPVSLRRRLVGLVVALATVLLSSGWWVAIMEAIPAASRPYIGGSQTNSVLDLIFGYDGLGRIFGQGGGPGGGGGGGGGFSGTPGLLRLFNDILGGQASWLLPFALIAAAMGLVLAWRAPRTDLRRAGYLLWGGWLVTHAVVFSFMSGIIHSYYTVAMAPAIGALVGAGFIELWKRRERQPLASVALGALIAGSAIWAWMLLDRTPDFAPGLGLAVLVSGVLIGLVIAVPPNYAGPRVAVAAGALGVAVLLAGPAAYAADAMGTSFAGGDPQAGPSVARDGGFGAGGFGGPGGQAQAGGTPPSGALPGGPAGAGGFGGGFGGPGGDAQVDDALIAYLVEHQGDATWIVAVNGSNTAGSIELATGLPVMAMGGFSGSDPAPTLEQLQADVTSGRLRYVLVGGGGFGGGGPAGGGSSDVTAWVTTNGTLVQEVGNGTLYDLSALAGTGS